MKARWEILRMCGKKGEKGGVSTCKSRLHKVSQCNNFDLKICCTAIIRI